jgi:glycopeptide antibiotics resistance protein
MSKKLFIGMVIVFVAVAAFDGYKGVALAASQSEGAIPQSGDLCGGTGGIGQIVSVENNSFTIKRQDDGNNQIISLTGQATIRTSAGVVSLSDLKIGDRVTLVGGPNPNGSFTANTVVVCAATGSVIQSGQRQVADFNKAHAWSSYMDVAAILLVSLIWIGTLAFFRLKEKKSLVYLLFFTIFYVYIVMVLDYTLFRYQSLLLLRYFAPGLMLKGIAAGKSVNLIPLVMLTLEDLRTSLLNILMMMPFGFGLPFVTNLRMKRVVVVGALFSIAIEFLQFITGFMAHITFRIADINDVIFDTLGAAVGYVLFVGFMHIYRHIFHNWKISANPILRYIAERPQIDEQ